MSFALKEYLMNHMPIPVLKFLLNAWSPFRGAGIKVTKISPDFLAVDVEMKLHWYNRNYANVHFGGSLFAMADPFHMLILSKHLGDDYIVWDKAATIEFKKPGRGTVRTHCEFTLDEIAVVKGKADGQEKYLFDKTIDIVDLQGEVIATVTKTLYVRCKKSVVM